MVQIRDWVDIGAQEKRWQVLKNVEENLRAGSKRKYPKCVPACQSGTRMSRIPEDGVPLQRKKK